MTFHIPDAAARIIAAKPILRRGDWGNGATAVCMMSALVPGAESDRDCVTAGWPEWLSILNHRLFDASVGGDEDAAAFEFALSVAQAIQTPRDYDHARDLFLIRRLDDGEHSALKTLRSINGDWPDQIAAVEGVVTLLRRRAAGEDVTAKMVKASARADAAADVAYAADAAADAAYAANAAARAAANAANAAAYAAAYAAYAAYAADAANVAAAADANAAASAYAARAANAANAAAYAAYAADAANAAARADLIGALNAA